MAPCAAVIMGALQRILQGMAQEDSSPSSRKNIYIWFFFFSGKRKRGIKYGRIAREGWYLLCYCLEYYGSHRYDTRHNRYDDNHW